MHPVFIVFCNFLNGIDEQRGMVTIGNKMLQISGKWQKDFPVLFKIFSKKDNGERGGAISSVYHSSGRCRKPREHRKSV